MNHYISFGFICSLLLISLTGMCLAEELPDKIVYVQGGESSIAEGAQGAFVITVKDIVPYVHLDTGGKSTLIPVQYLTYKTGPLNGALVLSGADNESTYMIEVTNLSLSNEKTVLTLEVKPLEFYEGEVLTPFDGENKGLDTGKEITTSKTGLYLETEIIPLSNKSAYDACRCACLSYYAPPGYKPGNDGITDTCLACCSLGGTDRSCAGDVCPYP